MDTSQELLPKYTIQIKNAVGTVIGDNPQVTQSFYLQPATGKDISEPELLTAIEKASAELRNWPCKIAGVHLDRAEVQEIVKWALNADAKETLGMLLDQPGGGKTVIMRDVLSALETAKIPTLAIKADTLSGIRTRTDLADRLRLPADVEECVHLLVQRKRLVIIIDQLDALSLALSRDQATLDVMLSTIAHLREQAGIRIIASCRTFDLNHDPRLSTIKVDHRFHLRPLDEAQINRVLQAVNLHSTHLLAEHRKLLTVPQHLAIYVRIVTTLPVGEVPEGYRTLQDLYNVLWQKSIEVIPPENPQPSERSTALYRLVDAMQGNQRLTAPLAILDEFPVTATYLDRVGFIQREGNKWLFTHQTLFDYCYARRFVAQGRSLAGEILSGPQGLFERSQMVQILAYLRGTDEIVYRRELSKLLFAESLRIHLRLLLIGWFGSLVNPTDEEFQIACRLMKSSEGNVRFFRAISGNIGWFKLLNTAIVPEMLHSQDEQQLDFACNYLGSMMQSCTDIILTHLRPHLEQSAAWDQRISFCLACLANWESLRALDMLCNLLERGRTFGRERSCLYTLYETNSLAACRALGVYLNQRLEAWLAQTRAKQQHDALMDNSSHWLLRTDRVTLERQLLGEHTIDRIMERALQECPAKVLEHLLPWFLRATMKLNKRYHEDDYPRDPLFSGRWYGDHIFEGARFARRIATALQHLAQTDPINFRAAAAILAQLESHSVHRVLVHAYLSSPEEYANDIFEYLTTDARRLNIGEPTEDAHYDSRRLYTGAFIHGNTARRQTLEQLILSLQPIWELQRPGRSGFTQLQFLKGVPIELLSDRAQKRLQELTYKFPNFVLRPPQGITGGFVGAPIAQAAQNKMSDKAWLGAMRRYNDATTWGDLRDGPMKGGVAELSRAFAEQVKLFPERFYKLARRFDETISLHYISALISGLSESEVPAEWVFNLVRRFTPRLEGEFRRYVCWALTKRAAEGIPDDLLDLMASWARSDPDPQEELWQVDAGNGQPYYGGEPHSFGINTNRGAAVKAVTYCAYQCKPTNRDYIFQILEQVAQDPSVAVRICVIDALGSILAVDTERAIAIFESTLAEQPKLLETPHVYQFLYWTYYKYFSRIRPWIEALLATNDNVTRQAGARLVCLASFHYPEARELENQMMQGNEAMRRGAAEVYAHNIAHLELGDICLERLRKLLYDPDPKVRTYVGECFENLRPEHVDDVRHFITEFLLSPSLLEGTDHLLDYIASVAAFEHELALETTTRLLDIVDTNHTEPQVSNAILDQDLARLPLTVYTHTEEAETKSQAMALFERLLLMGSRSAQRALMDWDRQ